MSSKSSKKLSVPRELPEIEKDYSQLTFQAGALQYQLRILERELDHLNTKIEAVNREGAARKQLDAKKEAESKGE